MADKSTTAYDTKDYDNKDNVNGLLLFICTFVV